MPRIPIIMPQLGESIAEATIVNIAPKPGDMVEADFQQGFEAFRPRRDRLVDDDHGEPPLSIDIGLQRGSVVKQ